jgi:hypothetical protein
MKVANTHLAFSNLPNTIVQLGSQIVKGFFKNFFKNTIKAGIGAIIALQLPLIITWIEDELDLPNGFIKQLQAFAINPGNMIVGSILSSTLILSMFSFIDKFWSNGFVTAIKKTAGTIFGFLNMSKNTSTTAFSWGAIFSIAFANIHGNMLLNFSIMCSGILASALPQSSGLIYFARFYWNRFYQKKVLNSGLAPADEFIRGASLGLGIAVALSVTAEPKFMSFMACLVFAILLGIGRYRQKKGEQKDD